MDALIAVREQALQSATLAACDWLGRHALVVATAESCTAGLVAKQLTDIAGSSAWYDRGFVTYSNAAKHDLLGVDPALIERHGAVSREVALAMVAGVLDRSPVQVAVAVTGIAGPGGGVPGKPVGTVWIAWGLRVDADSTITTSAVLHRFDGDRQAVRAAAATAALQGICNLVIDKPLD